MSVRELAGRGTRALVSVCVTALILATACSRENIVIESHWSEDEPAIDGISEDWADTPLTYFEENQASLGLKNDEGKLYLLFCIRDRKWVSMITMSGVTLWLDGTGHNKKGLGMRYFAGPPADELWGPDRDAILHSQERMRPMKRRGELADKMTVIRSDKDSTIVIPSDGSNGPAVRFSENEGLFTYEFSVPLCEEKGDCYALDAEPGKTISIGLEWGGIDREAMQSMRTGLEGRGPPGGTPSGVGERRPSRGGRKGSMSGRPGQAPEKQEIWFRTTLALPVQEEQSP